VNFLLVHGGHGGAWLWEPAEKELNRLGHETRAVTLPTAVTDLSAGDPYPALEDDARVIREALDDMAGPVIVVAHSVSGASVTEAITKANAAHAVFVAAYMLDVGESVFGAHGVPAPGEAVTGLRSPENPAQNEPLAFFDGDANNPATVEAVKRMVPQSHRADFDTVTRAGWREVPNSYVIPENDLSLTGTLADTFAKRAQHVYRVPGGHSPFWDHPTEFARLMNEIADDVRKSA
jgi:pimeloyl-ACP methyl ester carboxylesterase